MLCCSGGKKGEFTIPAEVKEIDYDAFNSCDKLTDVIIPEGVTKIGESAFSDCSKVKSITIPKSFTEIGEHSLWCIDTLIKGYIGSEAEKYAKGADIIFKKLSRKNN